MDHTGLFFLSRAEVIFLFVRACPWLHDGKCPGTVTDDGGAGTVLDVGQVVW